jgi:putative peptide zinc metalloprotease protein
MSSGQAPPTVGAVAPLRLRDDLVIRRQDSASGVSFVVKDPVARRYFRLGELEHFIAVGLDGKGRLDEIRARLQAERGLDYPPEKIIAFLERMRQLGLLEESSGTSSKSHHRMSSLLFIKVKAFDPHRMLVRLLPLARPFFSRWFVVSAVVLLSAAMVSLLGSWTQLAGQLRNLMQPSAAPLFLMVFAAIAVVHELAHGITCTHFGGEVHEMGLLLVFFVPAVYCDVSDTWLFEDKGRKLWVSFAGVFFQLFIWSLAVLAWQLSEAAPLLREILGLIILIGGVTALLNLNPLIKLDGYYLLSDLLDEPNLHRASFAYLVSEGNRLLGRHRGVSQRASSRQRWLYLAYGAAAGVFSLALLIILPLRTAMAIAARYSWPTAVTAAALLVTLGVGAAAALKRRRKAMT